MAGPELTIGTNLPCIAVDRNRRRSRCLDRADPALPTRELEPNGNPEVICEPCPALAARACRTSLLQSLCSRFSLSAEPKVCRAPLLMCSLETRPNSIRSSEGPVSELVTYPGSVERQSVHLVERQSVQPGHPATLFKWSGLVQFFRASQHSDQGQPNIQPASAESWCGPARHSRYLSYSMHRQTSLRQIHNSSRDCQWLFMPRKREPEMDVGCTVAWSIVQLLLHVHVGRLDYLPTLSRSISNV
mmetsp:Transcript_6808/g.16741  ORF Transcript_6808/g.16741 Transcript_6808/m.16741 type:complete len:245 (+) Transcript_6808:90-824(+)